MTTSSRNPAVRAMVKTDGEEATKQYVREHYGIPDTVKSWKEIDMMAEKIQHEQNKK